MWGGMIHDYEYNSLLQEIYMHGVDSDDRTGVGTRSIFGGRMEFDISEYFPLLTGKKINWSAVVAEFLWMVIEGSTDVKWLRDRGHSFWNPWQLEDGTIGKGYGYQYRHLEVIKTPSPEYYTNSEWAPPFDTEVVLDYTNNKYNHVGDRFISAHSGEYIVVREVPPNGNPGGGQPTKFDIQFVKTGYRATCQNKAQLLAGEIKDPWYPRVAGVGWLGEPSSVDQTLHKIWSNMLDRCYNPQCEAYSSYGGKGVRVCDRWLCFQHFQTDVRKLEGYSLRLEYPDEYSLDKDILSGTVYSPTTCLWVSNKSQSRNRSNIVPYIATHEDGRRIERIGLAGIAFATGTEQSNLHKVLIGERNHTDGWKVSKLQNEGLSVLIVDQFKTLVADLKHNPNSRRHIINLWNPGDLCEMALPPCHMMTQWYTRDGKLDCQMYQRSADMFVGVPWNIAFYSLMNYVVAHLTGLKPGRFIWVGGDCHIYKNHFEQVMTQLRRELRPSPTLTLDEPPNGLKGWTPDNFVIHNYNPHPAIKAPVAV